MAEKYEFLSPEWMAAAKAIRDEAETPAGGVPHQVKMNLVITEAPFNEGGEVHAHMDTSEGELKMDEGHLEGGELTVTVDWSTAKAIFVEQNQQAGMQAFMAGKIKVIGDITKLMAMQSAAPDPAAAAVMAKIAEITI